VPIREDLREAIDSGVRGPPIGDPWRRIQRNQIHFALDSGKQLDEPPRVLWCVVHTVKQHIFERNAASLLEREPPACLQDVRQRVFGVRRNELRSLLIGRGVELHREVRHHRLLRQPFESRDDSDG